MILKSSKSSKLLTFRLCLPGQVMNHAPCPQGILSQKRSITNVLSLESHLDFQKQQHFKLTSSQNTLNVCQDMHVKKITITIHILYFILIHHFFSLTFYRKTLSKTTLSKQLKANIREPGFWQFSLGLTLIGRIESNIRVEQKNGVCNTVEGTWQVPQVSESRNPTLSANCELWDPRQTLDLSEPHLFMTIEFITQTWKLPSVKGMRGGLLVITLGQMHRVGLS